MYHQKRLQSGFSLVEVLMTVFVLAMVTGVVVVTLPRMPAPLMQEAKRFEAVVSLGAQQAKVGGVPLGLVVNESGYSMAIWRDGRWAILPETEHSLRRDIQLANQSTRDPRDRPEGWPVVVFDPLAGTDGARFEMKHSRDRVAIEIGADGSVVLEKKGG